MGAELSAVAWPVRTDRLLLRPATTDDLEATWQIRRLPEVTQWLHSSAPDRDAYAAHFLDPDRLARTLVVELAEPNPTVIGDLMVRVQDGWAQTEVADQARAVEAELGWTFAPSHGGQGYATEAVQALLRVCFTQLGLRRVTAQCFADNTRSWQLMERVGMRREQHTTRDALHRSGAWLDGMMYAMLAEEYRAG